MHLMLLLGSSKIIALKLCYVSASPAKFVRMQVLAHARVTRSLGLGGAWESEFQQAFQLVGD